MSAGVNSASKQAQEPCHETPGVEHSMAQTTSCCPSSRRAYLTVAVLFLINLLNYMDRFTIAGKATCTRTENNAFGRVFEMSRHDMHSEGLPTSRYFLEQTRYLLEQTQYLLEQTQYLLEQTIVLDERTNLTGNMLKLWACDCRIK